MGKYDRRGPRHIAMHSIEESEADRALLARLVVDFVRDVRTSLDPHYHIEFQFDDGQWHWKNLRANTERSLPSYVFDLDSTAAAIVIIRSILEFDFDDTMELWPVCICHGAHLMSPRTSAGRAFWACARTGEPLVEIGRL